MKINHTIQKLAEEVREYKKPALITPIFVVLEAIMEVAIPFIMAYLIDNGIDKGNMDVIIACGLILVACAFLSLTFGVLAGVYAANASAGYAKNLRKAVFYKVQSFSFKNIDKFSASSLITRLTTDISNIQNAFMMIIRIAIRAPVVFILSFSMVMIISPQLSLIFLVTVPILFVGVYYIIKMTRPIFERVFKAYDKLNKVVQENIRGIRVVKSFVMEAFEKKKFNNISGEIYRDYTAADKIIALMNPLVQFCIYLCIILISWFGGRMVISSVLTDGELISLISYAMQILMSFMMLSMIFVMITVSRASAKRIVEVLDEEPSIRNPKNPVYDVPDGSIVFNNVSFSYSQNSERCALKDVSLSIKSGETIGIIGETGSSKSTLIQLIPRLYDATKGEVIVGGRNVKEYDIKSLRNAVSVVLQKNLLFSGTIKENLRWGNADASDEEIENACRLACADEFILEFPKKYDTKIEQGGTNVSGGQKQRLCIARALLKKPKILILDDSTNAVDTKTDKIIQTAFKEKIPNTTKLIITQKISSIEGADRIIVLDGGRVSASGTHDELIKISPHYQEMYFSQTRTLGDDE
ncbi:MAG TPA: ABC transporter ATP-binding protein [Methanocorpusculum sp.]|nr:ABC transporter ATP-binding protein [Methanocorpusculum sp.]